MIEEDPERDPTFLPCLYEAGPGDDWLDPEVWAKRTRPWVNPKP